ncbi:hypothetical protein SKAU_G00098840 [Synaphobranchus kaupii]|uniref:Uncharacterized protein n=1 Tax=Synaphobranchus kaupii TaxID=118154 RepID=A0A9Q1J772_SYNKA|nr:hypothetical protein SKAU_G00098840 [Synaphobranchus kaupii]
MHRADAYEDKMASGAWRQELERYQFSLEPGISPLFADITHQGQGWNCQDRPAARWHAARPVKAPARDRQVRQWNGEFSSAYSHPSPTFEGSCTGANLSQAQHSQTDLTKDLTFC